MDEYAPSNRNLETMEILKATLDNEKWHALAPNFPSPDHDLLPQELDKNQLGAIIDAIKDLPLPADTGSKIAKGSIDLNAAGKLTYAGNGESKVCYCLEQGGRKMAAIVQGYQSELGVQIPDDPYLTKISNTLNGAVWEYSDLRTYAMLPLANNRAIRLQEFGEPVQNGYMSLANSLRGAFSRRTVTNYIAQHIPGARLGKNTNTELELQQSRHLLTKPGHKQGIFIDIPVEQRR